MSQPFDNINNLIDKKKYDEAIKELKTLLQDPQRTLQEQNKAQFSLGYVYYRWALKIADTTQPDSHFENAIEHFKSAVDLATELQDSQEQYYAQFGLGRCYYEWTLKADTTQADSYFEKAVEHLKSAVDLATELQDSQEQYYAQFGLGSCYYQWALKADTTQPDSYFEKAVEHLKSAVDLATELQDSQQSLQQQNNAQFWLSRCYYQWALKTADTTQADSSIDNKLDCVIKSKRDICSRFLRTTDEDINKSISQILSVLYLTNYEIRDIALSHYTNPQVCEKLFGIYNPEGNNGLNISPMRMNSVSNMNDPYEGQPLLDLLGQQNLELENIHSIPKNQTFLTCLSSRINDLNQFRLYGKEYNIEASGCCIVFNEKSPWSNQDSPEYSFSSMDTNNCPLENINKIESFSHNNVSSTATASSQPQLPIYQVAYIAYIDEYNQHFPFDFILPEDNNNKPKFGIYLNKIGNFDAWHKIRVDNLKEGLKGLIESLSSENKQDANNYLEYIRYLFKDFAFRDEDEFRLLKTVGINNEEIKYCDTSHTLYLEYGDITPHVKEIILGTNYESVEKEKRRKVEIFRHKMKKYSSIKISHSSLPIRSK